MSLRSIIIELRVDLDNPEVGDPILIDLAKTHARAMVASALLVSGKRAPQVIVTSGDMFSAPEEIDLREDELHG
jgi:hypothetical protein